MLTAEEIYTRAFTNENYSQQSPSCLRFQYAIEAIATRHPQISSVIDLGSGRAIFPEMIIEAYTQLTVETADLKKFHGLNCLHHTIDLVDTVNLQLLLSRGFDCITCLDVLEHIPEEHIISVVKAIATNCKFAIITVANHSSRWADIELHLIQRPQKWWSLLFAKHFRVVDATTWPGSNLYAYQLEKQ